MALQMPLTGYILTACEWGGNQSNQILEYRFWYGGNGLRALSGLTA